MPISAIQNRARIGHHQHEVALRRNNTRRFAATLHHDSHRNAVITGHVTQVSRSLQRLDISETSLLPQRHTHIALSVILLLSQIRIGSSLADSTLAMTLSKPDIPLLNFYPHAHTIAPMAQTSGSHMPRPVNLNAGTFQPLKTAPHSRRLPRYVPPMPTEKIATTPPDDIKIRPLFNGRCSDDTRSLTLPETLRHIGRSLSNPITGMILESKQVIAWFTGVGCLSWFERQAIVQNFAKIDALASQIATLLPGSTPLAITQYIIAPLLERAADDLAGEISSPAQQESVFSLLQQLSQQARISITSVNHREQMQLLKSQPDLESPTLPTLNLPIIHLIKGVNHIDLACHKKIRQVPALEHNGKVFALVSNKRHQPPRKYRVFFNYMRKRWEKMGNGRLNRFSRHEQYVVSRCALNEPYPSPPESENTLLPYAFSSPKDVHQENINGIEMFGRLVPFHHDQLTGETFIYDASQAQAAMHRVSFWKGEWHLDLLPHNRIAYHAIYNPKKGAMMNMAVVKITNGQRLYAQVNPQTGVFWGEYYLLDQHSRLVTRAIWRQRNKLSPAATSGGKISRDILSPSEEPLPGLISCQRHKRGIHLTHLCLGKNEDYPLIGEGSISAVYDIGGGYVVKKYKGKINQEYKSRLQYANNNAQGFNRYYGEASGFVSITPKKDGSATVTTRLKKISGITLNSIDKTQDKKLLTDMLLEIRNKALPTNLANILKEKGIIHYDINKGNIIYSQENGFSVIDFDSAVFSPNHHKVGQALTDWMRSKFDYVLNDACTDIFRQLAKLSAQA